MDARGVVGHVGRKGLRFALIDDPGGVIPGSMRHYGAEHGSSVAGTLSTFSRELSLSQLPSRLGIAVAGLVRGDAISITQTRWFVSRSGLAAMFGLPPLILNDFEAGAWALTEGASSVLTPLGPTPGISLEKPGTYCVVGMTSGLGVSVLTRDRSGSMHVLATEAGHGGFAPASQNMADLTGAMFANRYPIVAEQLISATGLMAIYNTLAARRTARKLETPEDITRLSSSDPVAREACEMLCEAFWTYASSLVLTYGAWDGVILTGGLAAALRSTLASQRMQTVFAGTGKHTRALAAVPRVIATIDNCELVGAAKALQSWEAHPN